MNAHLVRSLSIFRIFKQHNRCVNTSSFCLVKEKLVKKEYKTEKNLSYLENPDLFGTLSYKSLESNIKGDDDDIKEEAFLQNVPLKSQKLTIKQYADIIKQNVKLKRLREAIDVLEVRMLKEDRVKPDNYIYNILIGACADFGYTKKAFKLYNDMKKRALKPTGDTYTCLFEACINSPWPKYGLKQATNLRNLMIEKGVEPNLTNYNVMIKTFGRCGDLATAFKIIDEMIVKKIKIRVHTFNHLLQACISDQKSGLKHALIVWRKMLNMREKPNVYSFNLMLRCVKDCNLDSKDDLLNLIGSTQSHMLVHSKPMFLEKSSSQKESENELLESHTHNITNVDIHENTKREKFDKNPETILKNYDNEIYPQNEMIALNANNVELEAINTRQVIYSPGTRRTVPNLLSKTINIDQVLSLQEVKTPQDKFAIIGGLDDFLKEMECYSVKPNIKTFTQMLPLLDNNTEAENKVLEYMKSIKIRPDIDFYNMLIKKRCLRLDYEAALDVRKLIEKDSKSNKRHPMNKKHKLKFNIMTYGTLALACKTREKAQELLNEMKEKKLKINIAILGTMLQNATYDMQFGYVLFIMSLVKLENIKVNDVFLKHLEAFNDKCLKIIEKNERENNNSPVLKAAHKRFYTIYINWLNDINIEEALTKEHPWEQFKEPHPETLQRQNLHIKEPKKFYKRNRKFVKYVPKI